MKAGLAFGTKDICETIPHRYPMLMVDQMAELEPGKRGIGIKNVTCNESFFQGHFPQEPIMPGALIIECMAQVAAIILSASRAPGGSNGTPPKPQYLLTVDKVKFKKPVVPGDTMLIDVTVSKRFGGMARVNGEVKVKDEIVAVGELTVGGK